MVGLGLGSSFVTGQSLNTQIWRSAGELGFIIHDGEPLGRILSASGLRDFLGLSEAQGQYEPLIEQAFAQGDPRLNAWLYQSAGLLRMVINFLENAMRPDGIRLGGFLPRPVLEALAAQTLPLDVSVVDPEHASDRLMPRFSLAERSADFIPLGAGAMTLSSHANPAFSELVGALRSRS
ncbi:hypothetical protein PSQ19_14850 [Devosia algicola]|uniref:ROK family protein n=1 Tax=Devosia algicola TaxID=3026418 RepID=A0ABY7YKX0_9HYPH|nr:hypothetical protein [Devosia algicola]WDR01958.1 hypothetical protein PSQ19_14850 [Devosia algicola]